MRVCIVDPFPARDFSWERQFAGHVSAALTGLGHRATVVACTDDIIRDDPDAVLILNESIPKLTHHYTVGIVCNDIEGFHDDRDVARAIRSWDLVVPAHRAARQFVGDLHFPTRLSPALTTCDFHPTVMPTGLSVIEPAHARLVRIGAFSGLGAERRLLEELAERVALDVYGPPGDWDFLVGRSYRGRLPEEPEAVLSLLNRHGAVLVPDGLRDPDGRPGLHFHEACAARCVVFTSLTAILPPTSGDGLLHVDPARDPAVAAAGIADALAGLRDDPQAFRARAEAAAALHRERFDLGTLVAELVGHVERHAAARAARRARSGDPAVSVIMRCGGRPLAMVDRALASLRAQDYGPLGLILVSYAQPPGFDAWLDALQADPRFLFVRHVRCAPTGVRSQTFWAGLRAVETELFCNLDDDDEIFPDHIGDLVELLAANPDVGLAYSGSIRHEEDGILLNRKARFKGERDVVVPERRDLLQFFDFEVDKLLAFDCILPSNGWVARRAMLDRDVLLDPDLEVAEDLYFYLLLARHHRFLFSGKATAVYNLRSLAQGNSVTAVSRAVWDACSRRIVTRMSGVPFPRARLGMIASNFSGGGILSLRDDAGKAFDRNDFDIVFAAAGLPPNVRRWMGISGPESWGRWTDGPEVKIVFRHPLPRRLRLRIQGHAFAPGRHGAISVQVGAAVAPLPIDASGRDETYELLLDNPDESDTLQILIPHPVRPSDLADGSSDDTRRLGLALAWIEVQALTA